MKKETKITAPDGCEIEKVDIVDGVAVITFKEKERKLPKSWEEFCEMFPIKEGECYISVASNIALCNVTSERDCAKDANILPNKATAEAFLALSQLIQLRDCYNGDWVPDWEDNTMKYAIELHGEEVNVAVCYCYLHFLCFKTKHIRDEFLRYFRQLIEKLKPLYGIKKGGKE